MLEFQNPTERSSLDEPQSSLETPEFYENQNHNEVRGVLPTVDPGSFRLLGREHLTAPVPLLRQGLARERKGNGSVDGETQHPPVWRSTWPFPWAQGHRNQPPKLVVGLSLFLESTEMDISNTQRARGRHLYVHGGTGRSGVPFPTP